MRVTRNVVNGEEMQYYPLYGRVRWIVPSRIEIEIGAGWESISYNTAKTLLSIPTPGKGINVCVREGFYANWLGWWDLL